MAKTSEERKEYNRERAREYYIKNKERIIARTLARRKENPESHRAANLRYYRKTGRKVSLKSLYGLSVAEFDRLLFAQDHCCAVCGRKIPKGKGGFHVDHCHETNSVRGLLCHQCNTGIGLLGDNSESLMRAYRYLLSRERGNENV